MREITLLELLKNGVHFGHQKSRRHPKMEPYIFTIRNGVHIINLEKTLEKLKEALDFIQKIVREDGKILFVGTKRQAKAIIEKNAQAAGMPYITERWLGGLFTNYANVSRLQKKLKKLEEQKKSGGFAKYTKKEQLKFGEEIKKLNRFVGGIKDMTSLPAAVFILDVKEEKTAVRESIKKQIPIIAITDTNTNPSPIDYAIPANDDATKSIEYLTGLIAEAIIEGNEKKGASKEDKSYSKGSARLDTKQAVGEKKENQKVNEKEKVLKVEKESI